jgi:hypothetical protein
MLRRVALVGSDVPEEPGASFIGVAGVVNWERHWLQPATDARCEVFFRSVRRLLVAASVVLGSPILVAMVRRALGSSEASVLAGAARRHSFFYLPNPSFCTRHCGLLSL